MEWRPMGLGVRALAALSGRGPPFRLGGPIGQGAPAGAEVRGDRMIRLVPGAAPLARTHRPQNSTHVLRPKPRQSAA